jgi:hypothetical protein
VGLLPKATKRRDLVRRFRDLDWTGPHKGVGDHPEYMEKAGRVVKLPNPHGKRDDIGEPLLKKILSAADIPPEEWLGIEPEKEGKANSDSKPSNRRGSHHDDTNNDSQQLPADQADSRPEGREPRPADVGPAAEGPSPDTQA